MEVDALRQRQRAYTNGPKFRTQSSSNGERAKCERSKCAPHIEKRSRRSSLSEDLKVAVTVYAVGIIRRDPIRYYTTRKLSLLSSSRTIKTTGSCFRDMSATISMNCESLDVKKDHKQKWKARTSFQHHVSRSNFKIV